MKKRALITGIAGMDGSYLAEFLLEKDYEVVGIIRRHSNADTELGHVIHLQKEIEFEYGDLTDASSIESSIIRCKPHEVYHLGAQSQVRISFDIPQLTMEINAIGTLNVLEAVRRNIPYARMYNAATSEMFGNVTSEFQNEETLMKPVSPYGTSKLAAYHLCQNYRASYGTLVSSGILFNHESPRRGTNFVTMKIVKGAIAISKGFQNKLELGNLLAARDWGHAKDYVRAMWMMLQEAEPDDFVIATGQTHTVQEFCDIVFKKLNLNYKDYVCENPKFYRPNELHFLKGNAEKAYMKFGWKPSYTFEQLIDEMVESNL